MALRVALAALLLGVIVAVMIVFGVAGWRRGPLAAGALLVVAAAGLIWLALGRDGPSRVLWTAVAAVVGVVVAGVCVDAAPYSRGRLEQELDGVRLDFHDRLSQEESGNGRCSPACPAVTRIYRAPNTSERATATNLVNALRAAEVIEVATGARVPARLNLRQVRARYVVEAQTITLADVPAGESPYRVRLSLRSRR